MSIPQYKVLGAITFGSSPVKLSVAFASQLDPSKNSSLVNTLIFKADPGNAGDVAVQDLDGNTAFVLVPGDRYPFQAGTQSNCIDPNNFQVADSTTTDNVRVSVMKV